MFSVITSDRQWKCYQNDKDHTIELNPKIPLHHHVKGLAFRRIYENIFYKQTLPGYPSNRW